MMDKSFTTYPALLEPEGDGLKIIFPDFPDCKLHAPKFDDAEDIAKKSLTDYIQARYEKGEYVPKPTSPQQLTIKSDHIPLFVPVIVPSRKESLLPKWSQAGINP